MCILTLCYNFFGHPENVSFMQFSQDIDGVRQKRFTGLKISTHALHTTL